MDATQGAGGSATDERRARPEREATDCANADPGGRAAAGRWFLDPAVTYLNHGSFGACPGAVLDAQRRWRERLEAEPVRFLALDLEGLLGEARERLAAFLGARPDDLAFVTNATAGVNTVLRSLRFSPGDELLTTDHEYNASLNALRFAADRDGARVVVARIPFPITDPQEATAAILAAVTPRTRLALLDHVTSPTALRLPMDELVAALDARDVDVLVDGAHAPGMLPLDLDRLGAAYYTGNCHKWMCAPKGSAFLHVRSDRQAAIRPLAISHGANSRRTDVSRFRLEFDWTGTADPTAWLSVPAAIEAMREMAPGGWPGVMAANHELACQAQAVLCEVLGMEASAPESMLGSMAVVQLPVMPMDVEEQAARAPELEGALRDRGFEVPVIPWPSPWLVASGDLPAGTPGGLLVRVSAQRYNCLQEYRALGAALRELLAAGPVVDSRATNSDNRGRDCGPTGDFGRRRVPGPRPRARRGA